MDTGNTSFVPEMIDVVKKVTYEAYNYETISLSFSIVSHLADMITLPRYQRVNLTTWYSTLDDVVNNL